ncbi:3-hydroxyacyl-CoA dehydrogenase [Pochonia chlamydosporia 170]|uniref:L-gulonate 3-dehydrogenase n=1 Tax=Pochonia chlamydosporia 170 TaxID=1380566 RepID=A0A179FPH7_METCM|nr:3-hydroxyacyl-CoA dehydrogenase [Pochonia chlamydosporia 170]OAQ67051.2 3-hydroxyacyl-CoA dehydrogenase [Pochonia chlamydosporia 170]
MAAKETRVALIGVGTIGLSLAALHLMHLPSGSHLTIVDVRTDLQTYVKQNLPQYLPEQFHSRISDIRLTSSVAEAVQNSTIIQESGPENLGFKTKLWEEVEQHAPADAIFWTSTSGIPASQQNVKLKDKSRLVVVHPFNPPHILPLLEIVPSPDTSQEVIQQTLEFWWSRGREPILLGREVTGFVAGRLAWALLREAIHLVDQKVVTVAQLDRILETSMGPRWAYAGPFKSFHTGGGPGGLEALFKNVGGTVQKCWDEGGKVNVGDGWEEDVFRQTREVYGVPDLGERDRANRRILEVVEEEKRR